MRKRALATLALGTLLASRALAGEPPPTAPAPTATPSTAPSAAPSSATEARPGAAPAAGATTQAPTPRGAPTAGTPPSTPRDAASSKPDATPERDGERATKPDAASSKPDATPERDGERATKPDDASSKPDATPERDGERAIAEARRAVEDQRYDDALATLAPQLASASRPTRAAALEITAIVRLLLGRQAEGREAVAALYELAPGFLLDDPSLPPRVTRVFEAEAALPHGRSVTMAIRPAGGERGLFEVSVTRPAGAVALACSAAKPPSFSPVAVKKTAEGFRFRLPTLAAHRCYATARDADGLPLGRLGSAARPVGVTPPPPAPPLATRWWLWTAAGAAAAAIAAGVIVATQQPQAPPAADITVRPQHVVLAW